VGEFSPIGRLFIRAGFVQKAEEDQIVGLLFPRLKVCVNFDKKNERGYILSGFSQTLLVALVQRHTVVRAAGLCGAV
jgi:hypothetical protein